MKQSDLISISFVIRDDDDPEYAERLRSKFEQSFASRIGDAVLELGRVYPVMFGPISERQEPEIYVGSVSGTQYTWSAPVRVVKIEQVNFKLTNMPMKPMSLWQRLKFLFTNRLPL